MYLADLTPRLGPEPGKVRPVVIVQTDLLNNVHPCPQLSRIEPPGRVGGYTVKEWTIKKTAPQA